MIAEEQKVNVNIAENGVHHLVKGDFSPEEGSEILSEMLYTKINFNKQRRFSQQIRFGEHNPKIDQRIEELEQTKEQIQQIIKDAKDSGKTLRINANIEIEVI